MSPLRAKFNDPSGQILGKKTTASGRRMPPLFAGFREEKAYCSDPRPQALDLQNLSLAYLPNAASCAMPRIAERWMPRSASSRPVKDCNSEIVLRYRARLAICSRKAVQRAVSATLNEGAVTLKSVSSFYPLYQPDC
ncbi:hypothetical protein RCA23_c10270 [Planktomarina temperata RCA23]|uniref:Uncharacterized protein n=1 Tax=Planktomarina temperata RCA23 TaxID=666509 RepID=A0AAN0RI19_9RHOB|nr:hypothetical protein RCA23_c10270 [Planktomarina temperata RCA23]